MALLARQISALIPDIDFAKEGNWLQSGAGSKTYRLICSTLFAEVSLSSLKQTFDGEDKLSTKQSRDYYYEVLNSLTSGADHAKYPDLVEDLGFDSMSSLLDTLCSEKQTSAAIEARRELVRFLAAEATALRFAYRRHVSEERLPSPISDKDKTAEEVPDKKQKQNAPFSHDDARFVLCLLQELLPTSTPLPSLEKTTNHLISSVQSDKARLQPLFEAQRAADTSKAIATIKGILVDDYALRWATQLERMQCTLKAFTDIGAELLDAQQPEAAGKRKINRGGLPNPSSVLSSARYAEMNSMLQNASGILERFFDEPYLTLEGDLFPASSSSRSATLCVGMVDAAFCPISCFKKKTNFEKRNKPLMAVPDRGGRTNVSNFDRAVSGSSRQKDVMMRQGSGGGGRGRGGHRRGGGNRPDPTKSAEQVRSQGNGNWGGGRGSKK